MGVARGMLAFSEEVLDTLTELDPYGQVLHQHRFNRYCLRVSRLRKLWLY